MRDSDDDDEEEEESDVSDEENISDVSADGDPDEKEEFSPAEEPEMKFGVTPFLSSVLPAGSLKATKKTAGCQASGLVQVISPCDSEHMCFKLTRVLRWFFCASSKMNATCKTRVTCCHFYCHNLGVNISVASLTVAMFVYVVCAKSEVLKDAFAASVGRGCVDSDLPPSGFTL